MRDLLRNLLCAGSGSRTLSRCCLVALVLGLLAFSLPREVLTAASDPTTPLRYHWKAGQTYAYSVTVEVDQGEYLDVLSGTPTYTVVKTDADGTKLTFRGTLREKQQAKPGQRLMIRPDIAVLAVHGRRLRDREGQRVVGQQPRRNPLGPGQLAAPLSARQPLAVDAGALAQGGRTDVEGHE